MKKLISFGLLALLLLGCEKPEFEAGKKGQDTEANLVVSVFQLEQTPFSDISRTPAADACTRLNVAIYDEEGSRVKQTNQQLGDADFGKASFQLAKGTYKVLVVGHSASGNPTMTDPAKVQFTNATGYTDTFYYYQEVTIGDATQNLSVTLHRIVSLCRFVITDDYPQNVSTLRFQYKGGSGAFNAATGFGSVNSTQTLEFSASAGKKQFDLYTFLHDTTGTIHLTVTAYDANTNILYEKEFDIPMIQNQISWFSGPYFSDSNAQTLSTTIDVDTDWEGETHLTF